MSSNQINTFLLYAYRSAVGIMLPVLAWFLLNLYQAQASMAEQTASRVASMELWRAEVAGNRFSSGDWMRAKENLDASLANLDKRVTRTEDSLQTIKETLARIERKIDAQGARP